jgi:hypothetical protein
MRQLSESDINYIETVILTLISLMIVMIFLTGGKNHKASDKTIIYTEFNVLFAAIIDFFICFTVLGAVAFLAAVIVLLLRIPIYYYFLETFVLFVLSFNVFFTSPGYKIFRLFFPRYKIPILFNNAFYISLLTIVVKENNIIIGVIAGLYASIDFLCILIKRKPFLCCIFKINVYYIEKSGGREQGSG